MSSPEVPSQDTERIPSRTPAALHGWAKWLIKLPRRLSPASAAEALLKTNFACCFACSSVGAPYFSSPYASSDRAMIEAVGIDSLHSPRPVPGALSRARLKVLTR